MKDLFDDFDWEDMAMIGGMADEFSDEERYRRRRGSKSEPDERKWDREAYLDPEDEFDFDDGFRRRPMGYQYSSRRPRRRPFEQYAYEVARGLKHHNDPMYGPAKRRPGPDKRPKNYTDSILYGVLVKNAHLVSENFLKLVCTIFYGYTDQDIDCLILDPAGNPVVDGHEVFSTFDRGSRAITMNLRRHFANALRVVEHGQTGFSIQSLLWVTMVGNFLHEFKHALDAYQTGYMDVVPREEQERTAGQWAAEAKTYLARQGHAEMPELSEEPYFGPMVKNFLEKVVENDSPEWARKQRDMIDAGIFYRNINAGIEIFSMQEFYELSYRGLDGDDYGRKLNDCLRKENELEEQIWNQEEMSEVAIKEAISNSHKIRVIHANADGTTLLDVVTPREISTKNYYLWMQADDEETGSTISIRVDRIQEIVFLA